MKKDKRVIKDTYLRMCMIEENNYKEEINNLKTELEYLNFKETKGISCIIQMKYKNIIVELFENDNILYFYIDGKENGICMTVDGEYNLDVIKSYLNELL